MDGINLLKWKKISKYCISCQAYNVAVYLSNGIPKYAAWFKEENLGWFDTAKEAKHEAVSHYKRELAKPNVKTRKSRLEEIMGGNSS